LNNRDGAGTRRVGVSRSDAFYIEAHPQTGMKISFDAPEIPVASTREYHPSGSAAVVQAGR